MAPLRLEKWAVKMASTARASICLTVRVRVSSSASVHPISRSNCAGCLSLPLK